MNLKNKMFSALLAGCMGLAMVTPVMAQGTTDVDTIPNIEKTLQIAEGTTFSGAFNFIFTPVSTNNGAEIPAISNKTIQIDANGNNVTNVTDLFTAEEVTAFENAVPGEYVYKLEEENTKTIGMEYSTTEYTVHVYVKNKVGTDGNYEEGKTVDYRIHESNTELTEKNKKNHASFINTFRKDDDNQNGAALTISKEVKGVYADRNQDFTFKINFTKNSTDKDDKFVLTTPLVLKNGTEVREIVYGTDYVFTLRHGQSFTFELVPTGTRYTLNETPTIDYVASHTVVENGGEPVQTQTSHDVTNKLVGENTNSASYVNENTKGDITPTGIIMNNLPFILLVVLGTAGIGFYLASKRRMN